MVPAIKIKLTSRPKGRDLRGKIRWGRIEEVILLFA
jgi:hypothetical protein